MSSHGHAPGGPAGPSMLQLRKSTLQAVCKVRLCLQAPTRYHVCLLRTWPTGTIDRCSTLCGILFVHSRSSRGNFKPTRSSKPLNTVPWPPSSGVRLGVSALSPSALLSAVLSALDEVQSLRSSGAILCLGSTPHCQPCTAHSSLSWAL